MLAVILFLRLGQTSVLTSGSKRNVDVHDGMQVLYLTKQLVRENCKTVHRPALHHYSCGVTSPIKFSFNNRTMPFDFCKWSYVGPLS